MRPRILIALVAVSALWAAALPAAASEEAEVGVWQSGGLSDNTLEMVQLVADLTGATYTVIDSGTLRMMWVTRDGVDVQRPAAGYGYPMTVSVYDVVTFGPRLAPDVRTALLAGDVVMSERSAALRGARVGDTIELEGWNRRLVEVSIGAIAPDSEIGWAELILARPLALSLDLERPSSVRIWDDDPARIERLLNGLIPSVDPVRVSSPGAPVDIVDQTLPTVMIKERFGEFAFRPTTGDLIDIEDEWEDANIVFVTLPRLGGFPCHRRTVPYVRAAIAQVESEGLFELLDPVDFQLAGGCFNARLMRGGDKGFALSRHAWGVAFDVNPSTNQYGDPPTLEPRIGQIFRDWGFAWGAGWTVPDGMHFEWTGHPTAAAIPRCATHGIAALPGDVGGWGVYARTEGCRAP